MTSYILMPTAAFQALADIYQRPGPAPDGPPDTRQRQPTIREWAIAEGHAVGSTGRIPGSVLAAYGDAFRGTGTATPAR